MNVIVGVRVLISVLILGIWVKLVVLEFST